MKYNNGKEKIIFYLISVSAAGAGETVASPSKFFFAKVVRFGQI